MGDIDQQRLMAVKLVTELGYIWRDGAWQRPEAPSDLLLAAADAMHDEVSGQIEDLAGATEGSPEAEELERLVDLVECYRRHRPHD